jgi:hypothetical protein
MGKRWSTLVIAIETSQNFIEGRGNNFCRGCLGLDLFSALDLGYLPIANELLASEDTEINTFPLHLKICKECGLGQVADVVTPERIFRDYRYLSSMSTTFLTHASDFVARLLEENVFTPKDWVLEIASNDGYLLRNFLDSGITAIGIEPAENVAEIARGLGIETISDFFSSSLAEKILQKNGYPRLIIANNVMAHVPDLIDFVKGLSLLCGPETEVSIENPSLTNILVGLQFDTIYHEHYSYLTATSVRNIGEMNGLSLFKVEHLTIHGGSNRYWLRKSTTDSAVDLSVERVISTENEMNLFNSKEWIDYSTRISKILDNFLSWLRKCKAEGREIYGYGAAAKASTILNSIRMDYNMVTAIADVSLEKQERFMSPNGIKIISPKDLFMAAPTDVVIFPWNLKTEIATFLRSNLGEDVRLWCAIPEMHEVNIK